MSVKGIMDLGGSQAAGRTSKGTSGSSRSQAASSDLFKSIIGQKQAGSQQQSGLNIQSNTQQAASKPQQTQSKDTSAVQDTSSKDSASVNKGNDSAPADNLDNTTAAEDTAPEDATVSDAAAADEEPVMEDEAPVTEEAPAEEAEEPAEEKTDVPKQIFLMQMPVAAAAAAMAPVIISSENYQASTVETIVNDVVLDQLPQEPQVLVQVTEADIAVTPNQIDVEVGQFTVAAEAPAQDQQVSAGQQPVQQDAVVQITDTLQDAVPAPVQEQPAEAVQQQPVQQHTETTPVQTVPAHENVQARAEQEAPSEPQTAPVQPAQEAAPAEHQTVQEAAQPHETETARMDAADEFAAQVVREAKDMVREQPAAEGEQEVNLSEHETGQAVTAKADADDTDDAASKGSDQNKSTTMQQTMPGTATVAEDGRVDLRTSAAQPLEAEQFLQPETRQLILNRVVDQVRSAVSPDRTEFYIQLKPDFLGGLSIGLVAEEKGIVAKIMTTSQQVHSALQADMTALQRVLQERGINVVEMEVIYNQMADTSSKDNSDNRQQQFAQGDNRSHGRISEQTEDALTMYDTLTSYDVLTENGGSVEFTA